MIVSIRKGAFVKGIIEYHEKKVRDGRGELLSNNTPASTPERRISAFLDTAERNPGITRNKFLHISVSFNLEDRKIDSADMVKIGEKYLSEMGIVDTPVLIYEHADRKHRHFHIVTTSMNLSGKKLNDFNDHYRSQQLARKLEKELGLVETTYSKKAEQKLQEINATRYKILNSLHKLEGNADALKEIDPHLSAELREYAKLNTLNDYEVQKKLLERGMDKDGINQIYRVLNKHNLVERSYKQQLTDRLNQIKLLSKTREEFLMKVEQSGMYVRKISGQGESLTYGLPELNFYAKERELPVPLRYDYLFTDRKLEMSFDETQQKNYLRRIITRSLYQSSNLQEFEHNLTENNINFKYSSNARGVYGISFSSNNVKEPLVFTGSDIDRKGLSWNVISKKLNPQEIEIAQRKGITKPPKDITRDITKAGSKLFEDPDDEEVRKRKKRNDQDQDLEKE